MVPQREQLLDDAGRQHVLVPVEVREHCYRVIPNLEVVQVKRATLNEYHCERNLNKRVMAL